MPRFFTQTISREGGSITGDDAKHIAADENWGRADRLRHKRI